MLVNLNGNNVTQEAQDRGVAGNWASTYRDASESVDGWITIDPLTATVTGQVSERWTCTGSCLERAAYFDIEWVATVDGQLIADGSGWVIDGTVSISYSARRGSEESPSDCGGEPCYICADRYCTWDTSGTGSATLAGSIDGTFLTLEFVDQLAEDPSSMDFGPVRTTEFFMSRWLHQVELPSTLPVP